MSEKLDGVRAYWDGKQFISRQGNTFHAPEWFVRGLPDVPLDGELWIDRKKFQRTVGIVRRQDKSDFWKEVCFVVFDAPAAAGGFEERLRFLEEALTGRDLKFTRPHGHELCKDVASLRAELSRIESLGGEGLMLRKPGSKYEAGRSSTLLKVKSFKDADAVVIGHQGGAGKHKGRLGALLVRLADGTEFAVGTGFSDRERANPPALGATITFRYQELSEGGVPRFPSYLRMRTDVEAQQISMSAKPNPTQSLAPSSSFKPRYFQKVDQTSNKFWQISRSGCEVTTRWGRIGTQGQSKAKPFSDEAAAEVQLSKLIGEKVGEGYAEKEA